MCQVRQRRALELSPVVTHTPSIFQVLHTDTVHMNPPSNGCKYIVHGRCGDGDQREFDLETRVTTNGNSKSPRCFTVVR